MLHGFRPENSGTEGTVSGSITSDYLPAFAVFDGMGGESCGEIAAFLAAQEFGNYLDGHGEQIRKAPETLVDEIEEMFTGSECGARIEMLQMIRRKDETTL